MLPEGAHFQATVLPQYFQAYVQHVCPIRPRTCRAGRLRVNMPPLDIQMKRLDFLETLPPGARGLALELLDEDRLDDVDFLSETASTFDRYEQLFQHIDEVDKAEDHSTAPPGSV
jgi:hypothetical protein